MRPNVLRYLVFALHCLVLTLPGHQAWAEDVLDQQAQAWVQRQQSVRVAPDPDLAPLDSLDANGRHVGLSADLLQLISRRSGLRFDIRRADNFDSAREQLKSGGVEMLTSVFATDRRASEMLFSRPYLHLPAAMIGRAEADSVVDLDSLRERRIAVVQGHVWAELLRDAGFDAELQAAPSVRAALLEVAEGRADVYIGDLLSADHAMQRSGLKRALRVVGQPGLEADLAFGIRPDLPDLKRVLDQALASITVAEEAALRARWEGRSSADIALAPAVPIPASVSAEITLLKAEVASRKDWDEEQRSAALAQIDSAQARDGEADASIARIAALSADAQTATADIERAQATDQQQARAEDLLRWRGSLPQRASVNDLEQLLATEQAARTALQDKLTQATNASNEWQQRPGPLRRELSELSARIDSLSPGEEGGTLEERIERLGKMADLRALRARQALLLAEQSQLDLQLEGAEARKQNLARDLGDRNERVATLEQLIAERSNNELSTEIERLQAQAELHENSPAPLRDLARENLESAEQLLALTQRIAELRERVQALTTQTNRTGLSLSNAQARIKIGGITDSIGKVLMAERRKLPSTAALRSQQLDMRAEAAEAQLAQIALSEERDALASVQGALAERLAEADSEPPLAPERKAQLTDLLLLRVQLLPRLQQQYLRLTQLLGDADTQLEQLIGSAGQLTALLDQNLLWVPSHPPVSLRWTGELWEQWRDLLKPTRWRHVAERILDRLPENPLWIAGLLLPLVLVLLRRRIDRALKQLADNLRRVREDRYRYTMRALVLTAVRAAPMMLLMLMLGHILQSVGAGGRFTHSLGRALSAIAPYLYVLTLTIAMCRDNGLAQAHLRWPRARRAAILRLRSFLYLAFIPLLVLASVCFARDLDSANGTLLRMVLVILHLSLAAISWWLLHPERLLSTRGGSPGHQSGMKRALRLGLTLAFLMLAALPLFGFVLTSALLLKLSLSTLAVLLAVSLAHGLVLRWLMLGERRLALARQAQAGEADKGDAGGANLDAPELVQDSVNVRLASSQSRRLLRAFTVLLLVLGLAWSLAEVAPAFTLLDRIVLWHTSEMVDGAAQMRAVSLADLSLALITLVLGISAARNLPGLLEIMLLERFLADASMRYAIVAVTRYVITFVLLVAVFSFLGLRWGHLQWLAAGFSVGLGFGLQEIFGNFVAGLILLFERPFRVGDVVTIGELTGTVRRIRTRATTIADFDNREIVIPNKTFITERFVNWTLSDTTTRIIIKVGVSYDSDPALVRSTLLQLAQQHPAVLADPPPAALFMALADSTLSFELRCFVREIGDRLRVSDDLHAQIIDSFRRLGISIAYPQLDLHLHRPTAKKAVDEGERAREAEGT